VFRVGVVSREHARRVVGDDRDHTMKTIKNNMCDLDDPVFAQTSALALLEACPIAWLVDDIAATVRVLLFVVQGVRC
jgi:hypothetical protein